MKFAVVAALASGALSISPPSSPASGNGIDLAKAISTVAKMDWEVDTHSLSRLFQLPDLETDIKWQGPSARFEAPFFSAYYDPRFSKLGITGLSIFWQIGLVRDEHGRPAIFNYLMLSLSPSNCPSDAQLSSALGVEPDSMNIPGPDAGPSYRMTTFTVPQIHGLPVQVSYTGSNTCRLTVSHIREI